MSAKLEPIENQPGLFRDTDTGHVYDVRVCRCLHPRTAHRKWTPATGIMEGCVLCDCEGFNPDLTTCYDVMVFENKENQMKADQLVARVNENLKRWAEEVFNNTDQDRFHFQVVVEKDPDTGKVAYLMIEEDYYGYSSDGCDDGVCDNEGKEDEDPCDVLGRNQT